MQRKGNTMNVVYASNDNYARHLAVSMVSLLEHSIQVEKLDIYVLSVEMTDAVKNRLSRAAQGYGRQIRFVELGDLRLRFSYEIDTRGFDISALSRLFIGEVLPGLDRVLYLDCDTVVLQSLERLWHTDLKENILGMVMEPTIYPCIKHQIGLLPKEPYYNSGVLLIDLKQWRSQKAQDRLLDFYRVMDGALFACDQDTINGALKGSIRTLSPKYNFFTNYRYFPYRELVSLSPAYKRVPKAVFQAAKRHPAIVHYMGDERPWIAGNWNHYRAAYEYYLKKTPWRDSSKEEGKRLYMLAYHFMNYLTAVCPGARRVISRTWGMQSVDRRASAGRAPENKKR